MEDNLPLYNSLNVTERKSTYSLIIMEIFLESFSCLGMDWFMSNVWVLFVSGTLIILWTVGFPVSQAHPAEVMFTVITLHMIAASILLNTDVTTRTLKPKFQINYWKYHNLVGVSAITLYVLLALVTEKDWWLASGCNHLYPRCYDPQKNTSTWEHQN